MNNQRKARALYSIAFGLLSLLAIPFKHLDEPITARVLYGAVYFAGCLFVTLYFCVKVLDE